MKREKVASVPDYWQERYEDGGFSGSGSIGELGRHRVQVVGELIREHDIKSINDFGCGDGTWLSMLTTYLHGEWGYVNYSGYDVSQKAVEACQMLFTLWPGMSFSTYERSPEKADLSLSCDVIYHILNDREYNKYMARLFEHASRFVIIYSSNEDKDVKAPHIRHRRFSDWIDKHAKGWELIQKVENPFKDKGRNPSLCDHYIYENHNL